jgi:hypothetical protein
MMILNFAVANDTMTLHDDTVPAHTNSHGNNSRFYINGSSESEKCLLLEIDGKK